ncbi:hypothetical protein [Streptosporangium roseum]|uniref:hypothetical protein n=1 Tax=Streptosporangium roseum TaxID=2001 RepID=UPI003332F75F
MTEQGRRLSPLETGAGRTTFSEVDTRSPRIGCMRWPRAPCTGVSALSTPMI